MSLRPRTFLFVLAILKSIKQNEQEKQNSASSQAPMRHSNVFAHELQADHAYISVHPVPAGARYGIHERFPDLPPEMTTPERRICWTTLRIDYGAKRPDMCQCGHCRSRKRGNSRQRHQVQRLVENPRRGSELSRLFFWLFFSCGCDRLRQLSVKILSDLIL